VGLSSTSVSASGGTLAVDISIALTSTSVSGQTSSFPINLTLDGSAAAAYTGALEYVNTGWQPINTSGGASIWTDIDTQQA